MLVDLNLHTINSVFSYMAIYWLYTCYFVLQKPCSLDLEEVARQELEKITVYLEQHIYRDLRSEQYGFAKVVMLIYRRLSVSCKEQMYSYWSRCHCPLAGFSLYIGMSHYWCLESVYSRWMVHISSIWKGWSQDCEIAQEVGEDERATALRAAALQSLSAMPFPGWMGHPGPHTPPPQVWMGSQPIPGSVPPPWMTTHPEQQRPQGSTSHARPRTPEGEVDVNVLLAGSGGGSG